MIDIFQVIVLAVLQGLTEFLPVSSSAHLLIPSLVLGWPDQGQTFDVAVHVGTLCAVVFYYRADLMRMAKSWFSSLLGGPASDDSRMVWYLALATIPGGLAGVVAGDAIEHHLRMLQVIATTTLIFGILLGVAERHFRKSGGTRKLNALFALIIGFSQALALVPGVSRSGITMTTALLLGMNRQSAARFSFMMSIPIIASAGLLKGVELIGGTSQVDISYLALGVAVSGVSAYVCIAAFLRLLDKVGFMPFVYYRVALAAVLFAVWLS
jgi:undecaprenyl-diphosphatase